MPLAIVRAPRQRSSISRLQSFHHPFVQNGSETAAASAANLQLPLVCDHSDALDLYNALAALPHKWRGAVILHYYAGLNSGEIAAATGLPRSTIRFHLMLARKRLRKALSTLDTQAIPNSQEAVSDAH